MSSDVTTERCLHLCVRVNNVLFFSLSYHKDKFLLNVNCQFNFNGKGGQLNQMHLI